tara:strand:+ start:131 stop:487 length:357 start_codon:yes stop_codon:yes gene_type:complete
MKNQDPDPVVSHESSVKNYFKAWREKNIEKLETLLSEDAELKDWEIDAIGIESVLKANSNIFESVQKLDVSVESLAFSDNIAFCKITVQADDDKIPVVDILEFNSAGKIKKITAYRGN